MIEINGNKCHETLANKQAPALSYDPSVDLDEWRREIGEKLYELCGMQLIDSNSCTPDMTVEENVMMDGYRRIRFVFYSEIDTPVPCYLLIPNTKKGKYPLAVVLQGHSTGFHNSIGIKKYERDGGSEGRGAQGLQAVRNGFAALCIEQRSMGERKPPKESDRGHGCCFQAHNALMLGRTTIGERVWDVSRALDLMTNFSEIDTDRILTIGGSGGGTASFYAACFDERIKVTVPGYAFCSYKDSIMAMLHCGCNYIPSAYRYFEMQDLACLIAPRKILAVNGELDEIFPIESAKNAFETVKNIYSAVGVPENCEMLVTPKGHFWMEDIIWPKVKEFTGW